MRACVYLFLGKFSEFGRTRQTLAVHPVRLRVPLTLARTRATNALQLEITPLTVTVLHPQFNQAPLPSNEH